VNNPAVAPSLLERHLLRDIFELCLMRRCGCDVQFHSGAVFDEALLMRCSILRVAVSFILFSVSKGELVMMFPCTWNLSLGMFAHGNMQ